MIILRGDPNVWFKRYINKKKAHTSIFPKEKKTLLQTHRKQESRHNINPTITPFEETLLF